jgi:beta-lactamase regulating signal transducer with metallopeptidase domain
MLGEMFYWIFNMSIAAVICGLPVLLIRMIKKIPHRVTVWLWLIPFIRMLLPVGIAGKYGLMTFISRFTTKTVTVYEPDEFFRVSMMNHMMAADSYAPFTYKTDLLADLFGVACWIWLVVGLALMIAFFIIYAVTLGELSDARRLEGNVYISEKVTSPALYGVLNSRIILPKEYPADELKFILMHERAHARRGDNFVRLLALVTVCVHWFNPLAWLLLKLLFSDLELACDEAVLRKCTAEQRKEYAHTLLSAVERTSVFASSFGGAKIRLRVENILSYKKLSVLSAAGMIALLIAIAYILLTNAA